MQAIFERLYRQVGYATTFLLFGALGCFGLTLLCALLGFPHAVASFRGVATALAYAFVALLILFLASSVVAAVIRWLDRRNQIKGRV